MPPKHDENPIVPKFEFWNDLPNEMRTECIKRMDFITRMRLRSTSKQDKLLVESAPKCHFDCVHVELDVEYNPSVICEKSDDSGFDFKQILGSVDPVYIDKAYHLVIQILKFATTEMFDYSTKFATDADVSKFLAEISNFTPFHFKSITLDCEKFEIIDFFLKNCDSLESIELERCGDGFETDKMIELVKLPSVINAEWVQMSNLKASETPYQLITNWLEKKDLELEKTLQIRISSEDLIDFFAEKFENRVVSKTDGILRIRTNDTAKHILIRSASDTKSYYSFLVIPSNQKESEYEKDDEWATDLSQKDMAKIFGQFSLAMMNILPREYFDDIFPIF